VSQVLGAGAGALTGPLPTGPSLPGQVEVALRSRTRWRAIDAVLSGLTVAVLSMLVARELPAAGFGAFALTLVASGLALGLARATIYDVFLVQFSDLPARIRRETAPAAAGAALTLGLVLGFCCCLAALWLPGKWVGASIFAVGLLLPGLLLQDAVRSFLITAGLPVQAGIYWLTATAVQLGIARAVAAIDSVIAVVLAMALATWATAGLGCLLIRLVPAPGQAALWFTLNRHLGVPAGATFLLGAGSLELAHCLVGAAIGARAVGALWMAQMFLVPAAVGIGLITALMYPGLADRAARGQSLLHPTLRITATTGLLAGIWTILLLLLPRTLGSGLAGATWPGAHRVLVPAVVGLLAVGLAVGPVIALRAVGRADLVRQITLGQALLMLGAGVLGADLHGLRGAAWALALAYLAATITVWGFFLKNVVRRDEKPSPEAAPIADAVIIDAVIAADPADTTGSATSASGSDAKVGDVPVDDGSADEVTVRGAPADSPVDDASGTGVPADRVAADQVSAGSAHTDGASADSAPANGVPVNSTTCPADDLPAADDVPVIDNVSAADDVPAADEAPADGVPAAGDVPAADDVPAVDMSAADDVSVIEAVPVGGRTTVDLPR